MPCSICYESGHNKRTCPKTILQGTKVIKMPCGTRCTEWTHEGTVYLKDTELHDGCRSIYLYEFNPDGLSEIAVIEDGEIEWFLDEVDPDAEVVEVDEEPSEIVFCCTGCDKQIIRDSEDHDLSKFDPENEDDWYCVSCPVPEEEDESDDEQISDEPDEDEPSQEELWDRDVPEDFAWTEADLDERKMTYITDSGEEVPIYWDDCDTRYRCDCKGTNYIYIISEEKMEEIHEQTGHRWGPHKWDFRPSYNFFDEADSTGPSVKTENCGQKFCCGELYHEVMADQFAYTCDEHDCGCTHPINYFDYGEGCDCCEDPGEHINGVCIETSN